MRTDRVYAKIKAEDRFNVRLWKELMGVDYQQVIERVEREDGELKKIVIGTGIGMLAALLAVIFAIR